MNKNPELAGAGAPEAAAGPSLAADPNEHGHSLERIGGEISQIGHEIGHIGHEVVEELTHITENGIDIDHTKEHGDEHSRDAVPMSERKGFLSLVFVWIGYVFTVTIMTAGGNIALGAVNFKQAMLAIAVGYTILLIIGVTVGIISMKTGLTFGLLARYTFGNLGSKLVAMAVMITLLGWFSINCYLIGSITNALIPAVPIAPMTILAGVCMTFTALKGLKIMNKVGSVATALVVIFGVTSIVLALRDVGGLHAFLSITQPNPKSFNSIVTIAVGSVVCGSVAWTPDVMRFAKTKGTAAAVMLVSLGLCAPFMLIIGVVGMLVYGQSDIAFILKAQGLLAPAWLAMVANIWSTAQGNAYSSSLNLANTFQKVSRERLLVIFGAVGTLSGLLGLYKYFSSWLTFLASVFPALGGVVIADYFFTYQRGKRYPSLHYVEHNYPMFNWYSFISLAVGILVNYTVKWGMQTVNAIIASLVVQIVLANIFSRKLFAFQEK